MNSYLVEAIKDLHKVITAQGERIRELESKR